MLVLVLSFFMMIGWVASQTPTWYPITPASPNTLFRFGAQGCFSINGTKKLILYGGQDESYSYKQETDFYGYCMYHLNKILTLPPARDSFLYFIFIICNYKSILISIYVFLCHLFISKALQLQLFLHYFVILFFLVLVILCIYVIYWNSVLVDGCLLLCG